MKFTAPFLFDKKVRWTPLRSSKFSPKNVKIMGCELLQHMTLGECPKGLLIPSFLLDNELDGEERSWEAQVFHNIPQKEDYELVDGKDCTTQTRSGGKVTILGASAAGGGKDERNEVKRSARDKNADGQKEREKEKPKDRKQDKDSASTGKESGHSDKESESEEEIVFSTWGAYFPPELLSTPVWDIVMGSAAAPTFFPVSIHCFLSLFFISFLDFVFFFVLFLYFVFVVYYYFVLFFFNFFL
jgi:hypothetical protein